MLVSRFPRNSDFFHVCSGRLVSYVYTRNGPRDCRGGASCHPGLRWRSSASDHVLGDRRLGDLEPKLQQFAMNSSSAWILTSSFSRSAPRRRDEVKGQTWVCPRAVPRQDEQSAHR